MLSADAILEVWERGRQATPARRAILVLEAAGVPDAASCTLDERDAALLRQHAETFGGLLEATVACPECGETVEFGVPAEALAATATDDALDGGEAWSCEGSRLAATLRRLTAGDLAKASEAGDVSAVRDAIIERAVIGLAREGDAMRISLLSADERVRVAEAAELRQPEPIELALECAACGGSWSAPLDVVAFVWAEVDAAARRLLGEIHVLARAYGWGEREILDLDARRRAAYLRLLAGEGP